MNEQKPEGVYEGPLDPLDGDRIFQVNSIWPTIQGEGPFVGVPAVFVRLAGCNLQCPACDTEYTRRESLSTKDILGKIREIDPRRDERKRKLVVITGGEPFRHRHLGELISSISRQGRMVQIETNGTLPIDARNATIVCSPKTPRLDPSCQKAVEAWKYVLSHPAVDPVDGLPTSVLGMSKPPARPTNNGIVYLQPADAKDASTNEKNLRVAAEICERFGYVLCLQIQKIVGLK